MTATLDWYGCATFRLTIGGLVVFLDAYIDRIDGAPGPGLVADDIDRCDFIVVGHSHFDHLWGAERIARRTGAKIIGSYDRAGHADPGNPAGPVDSGRGRRAGQAEPRGARVGVSLAALVRLVTPGHVEPRRGLHRRPGPDLCGTPGANGRPDQLVRLIRLRGHREPADQQSGCPGRRRGPGLRVRHAGGPVAVSGHLRLL